MFYTISRDHICFIPQTPCVKQFTGLHLLSFTMQNNLCIMELFLWKYFASNCPKTTIFFSINTQFFFSISNSAIIQTWQMNCSTAHFQTLFQYFFGTFDIVLSVFLSISYVYFFLIVCKVALFSAL